jgi:hypothetical protein
VKFLPINDAAPKVSALPKLAKVFSATSLGLGLTAGLLALAQPVQKSVQHVTSAPVQHPENPVIIGIFTVLNYIAGIAILAAVIFCGIWLYQRRGDDAEVVAETEVSSPSEGEAASESEAARSAGDSEKASDEKTAGEEKNAEVEEPAQTEEGSDAEDSNQSDAEQSGTVPADDDRPQDDSSAGTSEEDASAGGSESDGAGEPDSETKTSATGSAPQGQKGQSSGSKKAKNKGTKKSK